MKIGKIENFNFRELTNCLLLIVDEIKVRAFQDSFECKPYDNAMLVYGYVDHTAGVSFELLCMGKYNPDGTTELRQGNPTVTFKLRYDSVNGYIIPYDRPIAKPLQDKVEMIKRGYQVNTGIIKARNTVEFDTFRHPLFPDDYMILFFKDGVQPEGIWCRMERDNEGAPEACLLNEPNGDFGVHCGDSIIINCTKVNDELRGFVYFK